MSPSEAAKATGLNKLTLLKWIRSGRLAAERVMTNNGPGYDIKPEDLTQALQKPRRHREPNPKPIRGSIVESLEAMRADLERHAAEAAQREEAMRAEINDLRGQLYQTEQRLTEAMRALPAPAIAPTTPEPGGLARWFRRGK